MDQAFLFLPFSFDLRKLSQFLLCLTSALSQNRRDFLDFSLPQQFTSYMWAQQLTITAQQ